METEFTKSKLIGFGYILTENGNKIGIKIVIPIESLRITFKILLEENQKLGLYFGNERLANVKFKKTKNNLKYSTIKVYNKNVYGTLMLFENTKAKDNDKKPAYKVYVKELKKTNDNNQNNQSNKIQEKSTPKSIAKVEDLF